MIKISQKYTTTLAKKFRCTAWQNCHNINSALKPSFCHILIALGRYWFSPATFTGYWHLTDCPNHDKAVGILIDYWFFYACVPSTLLSTEHNDKGKFLLCLELGSYHNWGMLNNSNVSFSAKSLSVSLSLSLY